MINKVTITRTTQVLLAALMFAALPAMATPPAPNVMPEGTYTFSGMTQLSDGSQTVPCKLVLTGKMTNTSMPEKDGVYIDIKSGNVMPGTPFDARCYGISVTGFTNDQTGDPPPEMPGPWESWKWDSAIQSDLNMNALGPIDFVVESVTVTAPFVTCSGDVTANFYNGQSAISDPSYFTFDDSFGGCSVQTLDLTGLKIDPSASSAPDVNIQ